MRILIIVMLLMTLTGCSISTDLFGATERTQIRTQAQIAIAEAERDAAIGVAQAEASKSQAWAMAAPFLAAIIMGGAIIGLIVWWQGRIYYVRAKRQPAMLQPGEPGFYPALRRVARQHNAQIEVGGGRYYLVADDASYEVTSLPVVRNG